MTDKEFDKLFQDKLNNREFAFNPEAWNGVEQLLNTQKTPWYATTAAKWGIGLLAAASLTLAALLIAPSSNTPQPSSISSPLALPKSVAPDKKDNGGFESTMAPTTEDGTISIQESSRTEATASATQRVNNQLLQRQTTTAITSGNVNQEAIIAEELVNKRVESDAVQLFNKPLKPLFEANNNTFVASVSNVLQRPTIPLTKKQSRYLQNRVMLRVGGSLANGFNGNTANQEKQSQFLSVGLHYRRQVTPLWAWQVGAEWYERGAVNTAYVLNRKHYGFGAGQLSSHFITEAMQFVEIPIQAIYTLKKDHRLLAGIYAAYLLSTKNVVIHHWQTETLGDLKYLMDGKNHMEGFNRLDYGLTVGYEYDIFKSVTLGANANIGLRDLTLDEALSHDSKDYNHQVRLYINYSF